MHNYGLVVLATRENDLRGEGHFGSTGPVFSNLIRSARRPTGPAPAFYRNVFGSNRLRYGRFDLFMAVSREDLASVNSCLGGCSRCQTPQSHRCPILTRSHTLCLFEFTIEVTSITQSHL